MNLATARVFAIFLVVGTSVTCFVVWTTARVLFLLQEPPASYDDVLSPGFGALVLALIWGLPGQLFAATLAGFYFSFARRIPLWLVLLVLIPVCGLLATYQNISDSRYSIHKSDYQKLLYWLLVTTPGELICARIVTSRFGYQRVGDGS